MEKMRRKKEEYSPDQVQEMVDTYLKECGGEDARDFPTEQGFCMRWGLSRKTLEDWRRNSACAGQAEALARIGLACGRFWERAPLKDPRLIPFARFMLMQRGNGAYQEKPEQNPSVTIVAKGAKIDWGV